MAERIRAASPPGGHRAPVTGVLLAVLLTVLGVLGLQGNPAAGSSDALTSVAVAAHHSAAPATGVSASAPAGARADARTGVDDSCPTACGQPPRAGRVTAGEWHAPPPGGFLVPPGLVVPLAKPGPPLPAALGAFTPSQHSPRHSGRGPPPPTGI
ncbi:MULTISPECIES: hypothetical protein [Streptomyces]|uniref:Uncharacterized protein n=1 Tax=Streptomyces ortus TaxID=2867268 RepID=A0ABT3V8K2_9ACTN|nr:MULTISPECIES: hypothetical protein [Streptomyces]MCX4234975.1 hypothetical protein [Streptomyces ortus]